MGRLAAALEVFNEAFEFTFGFSLAFGHGELPVAASTRSACKDRMNVSSAGIL
jgi:hypothetical protein